MTATYAEEAETFDKTIVGASTDNPIEFLWVSQSSTTGEQTISTKTWPSSGTNPTIGAGNWILIKINVGKNLNFDSMTLSVPIQFAGSKGANNFYGYAAPLAYTDYKAAADAMAAGENLTTLVQPVDGGANVASAYKAHATSTNTTQPVSITLDASLFNNSASYNDGYVYIAFTAAGGQSTKRQLSTKTDKIASWKLAIEGTVVEAPAVTDFSDAVITWNNGAYTVTTATASGTAMLIAASFNGTTMVDAKVATVDAATATDGVISGTISDLEAGTSVKVFLWNPTTLAPAIVPAVF
ncbi:MAG: hypothetical protein IJZ81_03580, partial [Clostridia bacterium]|nr:hypothetical protein [Clostridia bacterium]